MEHMDIPKTPPPPYQTLPPTPALSTASVHTGGQFQGHQHINISAVNHSYPQPTLDAGLCAPHTCMPVYGIPYRAYQRYPVHPLNVPGIRPCGHIIPWHRPIRPVYYAHAGRAPALASAPFIAPLPPPPLPPQQQHHHRTRSYLQLGSISATFNDAGNLAVDAYEALATRRSTNEQYRRVMDAVALRLDDVLTSIDDGTYRASSADIAMSEHHAMFANSDAAESLASSQSSLPESTHRHSKRRSHRHRTSSSSSGSATKVNEVARRAPATSPNPFSKAYQYANAYTSPTLPPLKLYFATWPLICLASSYSRRAYEKSSGKERQNHISADWRRGTKAVVIKSVPLDEKNTIVLAIRGTQNFQDWAVNIRTEPTAPTDFLDDEGNLCHAGFLSVARKMIKPAAEHLQALLRENPRRASCSLVITGHSAGGAVAALLYCHMLSRRVSSELTHLQDFFKRIHCVTFGAPPISLLPLNKKRDDKNLFFGFINEGDPVARADKAYVKSLLELYARSAPTSGPPVKPPHTSSSSIGSTKSLVKPTWRVPEATLSVAGRIVVLRARKHTSSRPSKDDRKKRSSSPTTPSIEAVTASDADLRGLIFGDPLMHTMDLYARRIEQLAMKAVTLS